MKRKIALMLAIVVGLMGLGNVVYADGSTEDLKTMRSEVEVVDDSNEIQWTRKWGLYNYDPTFSRSYATGKSTATKIIDSIAVRVIIHRPDHTEYDRTSRTRINDDRVSVRTDGPWRTNGHYSNSRHQWKDGSLNRTEYLRVNGWS